MPSHHQGHTWAMSQSEILGSWPVNMNWPSLDYSNPDVQLKMIKQFENVANTPHLVEIDTRLVFVSISCICNESSPAYLSCRVLRMLWIAELSIWTTRMCDYNLKLGDSKCGRDQIYDIDSVCSGTWKRNTYGLREKYFSDGDQCQPYDGGVCLPTSQMHPDDLIGLGIDPKNITKKYANESWCPVFEGWTEDKMKFCIRKWYEIADGAGGLVVDSDVDCEGEFCNEYMVKVPIPYSSGPSMTATSVVSHELTLEMMRQTRAYCDDDDGLHCWMSGILPCVCSREPCAAFSLSVALVLQVRRLTTGVSMKAFK